MIAFVAWVVAAAQVHFSKRWRLVVYWRFRFGTANNALRQKGIDTMDEATKEIMEGKK